MIGLLRYCLLAMLIYSAGTVYAADQIKIGVANAIRILEQSPQAEQAKKVIEKEFSPRDKELIAQSKKVRKLEDRLTKDGAIMSADEKSQLERDILAQRRELRRTQEEFREDLSLRRNELRAEIQEGIIKAIQKVAKEKNYDVILGDGVIYAGSKVDITDLIIEYLKQNDDG